MGMDEVEELMFLKRNISPTENNPPGRGLCGTFLYPQAGANRVVRSIDCSCIHQVRGVKVGLQKYHHKSFLNLGGMVPVR